MQNNTNLLAYSGSMLLISGAVMGAISDFSNIVHLEKQQILFSYWATF
jgi:hypothetical protein